VSALLWQVTCSQRAFESCRVDPKFPYIVALARAVNALLFVRSVMNYIPKEIVTPAAKRDRLNSYLFGSAIMYEVLHLIRDMGREFRDDDVYQKGLRSLLADPTAQQIEQDYLKKVRHNAVFHFDVDMFREKIENGIPHECLFISSTSKVRNDLHYPYADIVAAEILTGCPIGREEFPTVLADAAAKTDALVTKFVTYTEDLISELLPGWGFTSSNFPAPTQAKTEL
jgi:hypothetical protein